RPCVQSLSLHDALPISPGGDHHWSRLSFGVDGEGVAVLAASKDDARLLHKKPEAVHGVLRLADHAAARSRKTYIGSWRMFLRARSEEHTSELQSRENLV